jgi:hypothetical protein
MAQMSVQVSNRVRMARYVVSSAQVHGELAAAALSEHFALLGITPPPAPKAFVAALSGMLDVQTTRLEDQEKAYTREQADDPAVRDRRDTSTASALIIVTEARALLTTVGGESVASAYGFANETPRTPRPLRDYGTNAVNLLRATPKTFTSSLVKSLETSAIADAIDEAMAPLSLALDDNDTETRELQAALAARDKAVDAWERTYRGVADVLAGLYRLAGLDALAERVRPTTRRTSGEQGPDESEAPEAEAPPADAEAPLPTA